MCGKIHHEASKEIVKLSMDFRSDLSLPPAKPMAFHDQRFIPYYLRVCDAPFSQEETAAGFKVISKTSNPRFLKVQRASFSLAWLMSPAVWMSK